MWLRSSHVKTSAPVKPDAEPEDTCDRANAVDDSDTSGLKKNDETTKSDPSSMCMFGSTSSSVDELLYGAVEEQEVPKLASSDSSAEALLNSACDESKDVMRAYYISKISKAQVNGLESSSDASSPSQVNTSKVEAESMNVAEKCGEIGTETNEDEFESILKELEDVCDDPLAQSERFQKVPARQESQFSENPQNKGVKLNGLKLHQHKRLSTETETSDVVENVPGAETDHEEMPEPRMKLVDMFSPSKVPPEASKLEYLDRQV